MQKNTNVGKRERSASVIGGGALLAFALARRGNAGLALAATGGTLLWRGLTGHCPVFQFLGISTSNRLGRNISVPYELGIRVDKEVYINKSADELYSFWRELSNLPKFMEHLDEVQVLDDKRSRWVASGPAGMSMEWEAEIINEIPGKLIGWRSLPGSDVDTGGSVHFDAEPGAASTRVKVELQYNPPAGSLGAAVARLLGRDPARQIESDLHRFKELVEQGAIQNPSLQLKKRAGKQKREWNRDEVGRASEDSFPASDPPSWTPAAL